MRYEPRMYAPFRDTVTGAVTVSDEEWCEVVGITPEVSEEDRDG